ncbi:lantibiotic dehydratase family protein [Flavobacteriaceae bacterium KMM 6898]|nr:lantibiotic dehydratase family protein [Flavobacteriaceae bacterium KMM 6898]
MGENQNTYEIFEGFVLRAPLFPIKYYFELTKNQKILDKDLFDLLNNEVLFEALLIASPEITRQVSLLLEGGITDKKKKEKLKRTIIKYLVRISTRSTPFGLFAGCTSGYFSKSTKIFLEQTDKYIRRTRFDMHFLISLAQELTKNPKAQQHLHWRPNTSLYKVGKQWRYIQYAYFEGKRTHSLEAVSSFKILDQIIKNSNGGRTIKQLKTFLIKNEISGEDAENFIYELINNNILISNLEPSLTGNDFLDQLITDLKKINGYEKHSKILSSIKKELKIMDNEFSNSGDKRQKIIQNLKALNYKINEQYLLQTDLFLKAHNCQLDSRWINRIKEVFRVFNKITKAEPNTAIALFIKEYEKRYETQEVPLVEALDSDIGIGFPVDFSENVFTPFLDDLSFPSMEKSDIKIIWDNFSSLINEKLQKAISNNDHVIYLQDSELIDFKESNHDLPDTLFAKVQLTQINNEDKLIIEAINGRSASTLLTRFCYGDRGIHNIVSKITDVETELQKGKEVAEIIHISSDRIGNVLQRPIFRNSEIPYLAKSGEALENQIPITDIMISIRNNHIILRSSKTGKEIIPYLTNAHNFDNSTLPIYRFLSSLGNGATRNRISFDWKNFSTIYHFLPRVEYKGVILSKAKWIIKKAMIQNWYDPKKNKNKLLEEVNGFRNKMGIPQYVCLGESDKILIINLKNYDLIDILMAEVKDAKWFVFEEFLFMDGISPVKNNLNESFMNEFILGFYKSKKE